MAESMAIIEVINQNGLEFNQAYYYVCGRNDADTNVYLPAVVFAEEYVAQRNSGGYAHSVQGFYDETRKGYFND